MLHILSFQLDSNGTPENCHRQSGSDNNRPYMADATLVSKATTNDMHGQLSTADQHLLTMPGKPQFRHPLGKMRLGSFRVSGNPSRVEAYHRTLKTFCYLPGESPLKNDIGRISKNGCHFVTKDKLIFLRRM